MLWNFKKFLKREALIDDCGNRITYESLMNEGNKIAQHIPNRCLVFVLCENKIGSMIGYTAFIQNNIVPALLSNNLDLDMYENLCSAYKPSFLWVPKDSCFKFTQFKKIYECYDYCLLQTFYSERYAMHRELALLLTTSGSTGSPKFVRQTYTNMKVNAQSIIQYLNISCDTRSITTLPMHYTYGLSVINSRLLVGATVLVTDKSILQKEFWSFFEEERATSFNGVPYTFEMLQKIHFQNMALPSLTMMTCGGGKASREIQQSFGEYAQKFGKKFIITYGQTEATARMGYLPFEKVTEKIGSFGIAIPGGKFYLIDEKGNKIEKAYELGELVYEGKNVTLGYATCGEDLAKSDQFHGVLHTGDIAQYDEDGFFYIKGRKKRFLKLYGSRVSLDDVETIIKEKYPNLGCACSGLDNFMYIFLTDQDMLDEVKKYISQKLKVNSMAFQMIFVNQIPKNESGKVLYQNLNKLL